MAEQHLQALNIGSNAIRRSAEFSTAYAYTCLIEANSIIRSLPGGSIEDGENTIGRRPQWPRLDPVEGAFLQREPLFTVVADAASSYRDAGQAWMYLDSGAANDNLSVAGDLFWRLGYPYGLYLQACLGFQRRASLLYLEEALDALSESYLSTTRTVTPLMSALRHPQQQAYLLLAVAGTEFGNRTHGGLVERVLFASPHRSGVAPVGALGIPIRTYWSLAESMMLGNDAPEEGLTAGLVDICRRYERAMSLGQVNQYLWQNGSAPVNIGDIDISGIATLVSRKLGTNAMRRILVGARQMGLTTIGLGALEVGMDLVDGLDK